MLKFEHALRVDKSAYGSQAALDAWAKNHNTHLMRDLIEPVIYFSSIEDLTLFKLQYGGEYVDALREG